MQESRQVNLSEVLYAQIVDMIAQGEFPERSRLPTEAELAGRFGVSRPTVREALSRLRFEGIIASRRGSGSYVLRRPEPNPTRFAPLESLADVQRCYAFRRCVEAGAAELAAEMRDQSDLETIEAAYAELVKALQADAPSVEEDLRFHLAIARASHNPFFMSAIEMTNEHVRFTMQLSRTLSPAKNRARREQVQEEHRAIMEAIVSRSPAQAFEAMRRHIENSRRRIFEGPTRTR